MPNIQRSESMDTFKGINNVLPAHNSIEGYLKELVNLDIDKSNNLTKRKGFILKDSGNYHSLWANEHRMYAVRNGDLVRIFDDASFQTIVSSIGESRVTFEFVDGVYYYTSKFKSGKIINDTPFNWGIDIPNHLANLSENVTGNLSKGTYQIAITFEKATQEESGINLASVIEIQDSSSIQITNIPVSLDSEVAFTNVYATLQNGDDFNRVARLPAGTTSYFLNDVIHSDKPLQTMGLYPAPNGSIVRWAHGRLWIAQDNILWYSNPYEYDLFNLKGSYLYFDEEITAVCPTPGGLWVSSDKIYYLSGKDPDKVNLSEKGLARVVRGSDVKFSGAYLFIENTPLGYKWLVTTDRGMYVLFNDGVILNITEQNVSLPKAFDAAAGFIQEDGINRYVSLLREKEKSQNTAVGDLVSSTIIRNGITIT